MNSACSPKVSYIIVNYNGFKFLDSCISSIKKYSYGMDFEIVIIDNCSSDESCNYLRNLDDDCVKFIESTSNLGFTGGNNKAAEYARGDFLIFINNDTEVKSDMRELLECFSSEFVGISAPYLTYANGDIQFSLGYRHTPINIVLSWLGFEKNSLFPKMFKKVVSDVKFYNDYHDDIDWVSGACFCIKKELWNQLSGFDDQFFMYCEDVDLCERVRQLGLKICYTPNVSVIHYEGAGKIWIGKMALLRTIRSYLLYTKKHFSTLSVFFVKFLLLFVFFARFFVFSLKSALTKSEKFKLQKEGFAAACRFLLVSFFTNNYKNKI